MLTVSLLVCAMMALAAADDNSTVSAPVRLCAEGWDHFNSTCYRFVSSPKTWAEAEKNCQRMGANLASVHSLEEDRFLQEMILRMDSTNPHAWIGGSDCQQDDVWFWSNGKVSFFTNYCESTVLNPHRKHGCILMNFGAKTCWINEHCSFYDASVCAIHL